MKYKKMLIKCILITDLIFIVACNNTSKIQICSDVEHKIEIGNDKEVRINDEIYQVERFDSIFTKLHLTTIACLPKDSLYDIRIVVNKNTELPSLQLVKVSLIRFKESIGTIVYQHPKRTTKDI